MDDWSEVLADLDPPEEPEAAQGSPRASTAEAAAEPSADAEPAPADPSLAQRERGVDLVIVLSATLEQCTDDREAAHILYERAEVRVGLADPEGALEDLRDATRRNADAPYLARAYYKAALRAGSASDVIAALELAARLEPQRELRGALELARGSFCEHEMGDIAAARSAYARAAEASPREQAAWLALERLAVREQELAAAAEAAQRLCVSTSEAELAGEHGARSARYLEAAGRPSDALAAARQARLQAPSSPSVEAVLERLLAGSGNYTELVQLRERQVARGTMPKGPTWLDVGLLARYRIGDRALAARAFEKAADALSGPSKAVALAELAGVLEREQRWDGVAKAHHDRLELSADPARRCDAWYALGRVRELHLDDRDGGLDAYERALTENGKHAPSLRAAARLYELRGDRRSLVAVLRALASAAETPSQRVIAAARAAALLAADEADEEQAIELLRSALGAMPASLAAIEALESILRHRKEWRALADLYEAQMALAGEARRAWLWMRIGDLRADLIGDAAGAIDAYERASATDGGARGEAAWRLAELLEREERWAEVVPAWERALEGQVDPARRASALGRLALAHERLGDRAAALEALRKALRLAPAAHPVHVAATHMFAGDVPLAELSELFDVASRMGNAAERAAWLVRSAELLAELPGRAQDAIARLRQARELSPDHPGAKAMLREVLAREERWDALRPLFAEDGHATSDPEDPETVVRRAALAEATDAPDEAFRLYARAMELGVDGASVAYLRLAALGGHWQASADAYARMDGSPLERAHARYRAGEIAASRLHDLGAARDALVEASQLAPDALAPRVMLANGLAAGAGAPRMAAEDDDALTLLGELEQRTDDPAFARALALSRSDRLRRLGRHDEELALCRELLARAPRDPVLSVRVELGLEQAGEREALCALYGRWIADPALDPSVRAAAMLSLGRVSEEADAWRDAADAYEAAVHADHLPPSRLAALSLPRIGRELADESLWRGALWSAAGVLPQGQESAACLISLARRLRDHGEHGDAIDAYEAALAAEPTAYEALAELAALLPDAERDERVADALVRALATEPREAQRSRIGEALAVRLLRLGRVAAAREAAERCLSEAPDVLGALMILAEAQRREERWADAAATLERVAAHDGASGTVRLLACEQLARLYAEHLDRPADADRVAAAASDVETDAPDALTLRLSIEELSGRHEAAATTMRRIIDSPEATNEVRVRYLLRLARLQEEKLDDPAGAIRSLGEVESFDEAEEAVSRLLRLGERSGRWDLAWEALDSALEAGRGSSNPQWEVAIRSRLASLLDGPLERPAAAVKHWERVVELDSENAEALERLSALAGEDHAAAIHWMRALVAARPLDVSGWRKLRQLYREVDDVDGAFCVEAVLHGAEVANEEESYFHQQRCAFLSRGFAHALTLGDTALLFPEQATPTMKLLGMLDPILPEIFPVDAGAYGAEPGDLPTGFSRVLHEVAEVLGVPRWQAMLVPARVGPAIEPLSPPLLLLPRSLLEAPRREQQLVCGAVFARAAFAGAISDPLRVNRVAPAHVDHLLAAVREVVSGVADEEIAGSEIYADIRGRVDAALDDQVRGRIASVLASTEGEPLLTGEAIHAAFHRASMRAAVLLAQDPAVAISALATWASMFDLVTFGMSLLEVAAGAGVLGFIVSEEHATLRRRLRTEVSS